jgi:DNA-binding winged helix-turn-helix (wHTH) protein
MAPGRFRFDRFLLDPNDRQLMRDDVPVELNARYLDALALLVREQGKLVSKNRFLEGVWRGVPVTDEALTRCIRTLRKQLGDNAISPRFIETVPKHGYRFIAPVELVGNKSGSGAEAEAQSAPKAEPPPSWRQILLLGRAGMIGGGVAGAFGGLIYGFLTASQPSQAGMGAISVVIVLVCLTMLVGLLGGAGVGFGIAAAGLASGHARPWCIAGGALGGLSSARL